MCAVSLSAAKILRPASWQWSRTQLVTASVAPRPAATTPTSTARRRGALHSGLRSRDLAALSHATGRPSTGGHRSLVHGHHHWLPRLTHLRLHLADLLFGRGAVAPVTCEAKPERARRPRLRYPRRSARGAREAVVGLQLGLSSSRGRTECEVRRAPRRRTRGRWARSPAAGPARRGSSPAV